jgi:hypothetical protein
MSWNFFSAPVRPEKRPGSQPNRVPEADETARTYKPTDITVGAECDIQRNIFGVSLSDPEMNYSAFELEKVHELNKAWEECDALMRLWGIEETQKVRFLQGSGWAAKKAEEALRTYVSWRSSLPPTPNIAPDRSDMRTWLYFYGRDKWMRPVMYIDCMGLLEEKGESHSLTFVQETVVNAMNYFVEHLAVPGHVEQVVVVANLDGCTIWNTPLEEMEKCAVTLTSRFRGRLKKLFIVNTPLVFYAFWNVIKVFIPERTLSKIFLMRYNHMEELSKFIDDTDIDPVLSLPASSST